MTVLLGQSAEAFEQTADGLRRAVEVGPAVARPTGHPGSGRAPENKLAVDAGLEVGPRGGIRVNDIFKPATRTSMRLETPSRSKTS